MNKTDIAALRMYNEQLSIHSYKKPEDIVRLLLAVQSQDFAGARWGLGQRLKNITDDDIEQAFTEGSILRTHVMRPTWHFVLPEDIRWLLSLTAPRVKKLMTYYDRILELDEKVFRKTQNAFAKALSGKKYLTRLELAHSLEKIGIKVKSQRLGHIVMQAELDHVICSGPRRGKQFTYALLSERAPKAKMLQHDEALATLVLRYFTGHGPAQIADFCWWSGLTFADAKAGIEMNQPHIIPEVVEDKIFWFTKIKKKAPDVSNTTFLLPNYDEYLIAYRDQSVAFDPKYAGKLNPRGNIFSHFIILGGKLMGTWRREIKKEKVIVKLHPFEKLTSNQKEALEKEAERYGEFLGLPVIFQEGF